MSQNIESTAKRCTRQREPRWTHIAYERCLQKIKIVSKILDVCCCCFKSFNSFDLICHPTHSETAVACASPSADFKRKKSSLSTEEKTEKTLAEITEEDLTTEGEPSEHYWKTLAERRRLALEETLTENHMLHDKVESLEQELNISRQMLDESNALVEVLNEMINAADGDENDEAQSTPSTDSENEVGSTQDVLNASIAEEAKERSNVEHNSQGTSTEDTYQSE